MANERDFLIASADDNALESGAFYTSGSAIVGHWTGDATKAAFRFTNVSIPQGTTVSSASLYFKVKSQGSGSGNLKFKTYGIKETNTNNFSSNPFGRSHTTAFDSADNPLPGAGNYKQITVTSIVNEILAQGGWSSGNAMGFFCEDNGSASDVYIRDDDEASILEILVSANPDFTPGPYTVQPNKIPAPQNYGVILTPPGKDALDVSMKERSFSTGIQTVKASIDGQRGWPAASNLEKTSHRLKYPSAFLSYFKYSNKIFLAPRKALYTADPVGGGIELYSYTDSESIAMALDPNSADPNAWYYYVFIDENL